MAVRWRLVVVTDFGDVTVVGAGLTGLAAASLLYSKGLSVQVLEARQRLGGRIDSVYEAGESVADLGPTWVWPEAQSIVSRWTARLGLVLYDQYEHGLTVVDSREGQAVSHLLAPGQAGSKRIVGGPQALIDRLAQTIPLDAVQTDCGVRLIELTPSGVVCTDQLGRMFCSSAVIVTAPARIVARDLQFAPALSPKVSDRLSAIPTWMARHAKVVIRYERAFWRDLGLSGSVFSRAGPLAEVHDHCGHDVERKGDRVGDRAGDRVGGHAALFGFSAWSPSQRIDAAASFEAAIVSQMLRCFGSEASAPLSITIKDWAADDLASTDKDLNEPAAHPVIQPELVLDPEWRQRLWFASAESARQDPGLIAGALASAERVSQAVVSAR